jgi:hypothetical protein
MFIRTFHCQVFKVSITVYVYVGNKKKLFCFQGFCVVVCRFELDELFGIKVKIFKCLL